MPPGEIDVGKCPCTLDSTFKCNTQPEQRHGACRVGEPQFPERGQRQQPIRHRSLKAERKGDGGNYVNLITSVPLSPISQDASKGWWQAQGPALTRLAEQVWLERLANPKPRHGLNWTQIGLGIRAWNRVRLE